MDETIERLGRGLRSEEAGIRKGLVAVGDEEGLRDLGAVLAETGETVMRTVERLVDAGVPVSDLVDIITAAKTLRGIASGIRKGVGDHPYVG